MNVKIRSLLIVCSLSLTSLTNAQERQRLSFEQAINLLQENSQSLKIADKEIEIAKNERDKLNAFWYPSIQSTGAYVHLSQKIEVRQPLSGITDPAKDFIDHFLPNNEIINGILDKIGSYTLAFPLAPTNVTSIDLNAEWLIFSGGKRFHAAKIGRRLIDIAHENKAQVNAKQQSLLVESYYGLRLAQQVVKVRQETYNSLKKHYENAVKLEEVGMIDKAGRLFAQVNMDEAKRFMNDARINEKTVQNTLKTVLNMEESELDIEPTSPLFMNDTVPSKLFFMDQMRTENNVIKSLHLQQEISQQQTKIDRTGYMPNIAFFGKQSLYTHGIQKNLIPRTILGVGFTWNIFDGLDREKRIKQSKLTSQTLALTKEKAIDDFNIVIDELYGNLQKALDNVKALDSSIALSEELVRIRKQSFLEGMATSTEVIDAETLLANVKVAQLAAYYEYDVALSNLLSICGTPSDFNRYNNPSNSF